jgi:hypothetical protein
MEEKMTKLLLSVLLTLGLTAQAATNNSQPGDFYIGTESINEHPTGNLCYLYVDYVQSSLKGKHCSEMQVRAIFSTNSEQFPKDDITLVSRITNYHRAEYPQQKTCAINNEGKTSGNDIYSDDDSNLYNDILGWNGTFKGSKLDLFVSLSSVSKTPVRVRFHKLNWMSEINYDCTQLKKQ